MIHFRIVSPADRTDAVVAALDSVPHLVNVAVMRGAAHRPPGDIVLVDAPNEMANQVVGLLRARGVERHGSITIERASTVLSVAGEAAVAGAPGVSSEAVVWSEVDVRAAEESQLTVSFVAMLALATLIAAVGILTDSVVLVIGAMVIGPEYGPLVALAYAAFRGKRARLTMAARTLAVGVGAAFAVTFAFALAVRALDANPEPYRAGIRPLTEFISHPDGWSVVVAVLAAISGTMSLTQARPNALVGVFISVTTVPALANVGVAAANGHASEARGALAQLGLNVAVIIVAATLTFAAERAFENWVVGRVRARRFPLP